ncbi:MAG TPA: CehA/McbA family metallohydrolase [Candidatus Hydrogenedentes bacterium]|nr:CehA/McbA family metallohydrolase [Candidatus Hydrogenedentota bacterium]HQE83954.1 CehA/McbA family metallohydrolase [Candidatus Hydrogenedentota bacterium]HQH51800.1 CehA/McbA family metallohydrolase [Candidatus Hydrogenedentota bacterium]HQM48387.1 CehA/McbA family metallohydrolase [Candidatus Hydrogenedentota bacterium]
MDIAIRHPYRTGHFQWLKGNLHTHTTNSDGARTPEDCVKAYAGRGYDFLMISDHDRFTNPEGLDGNGMVLIPGYEITANGPHILHVNGRSCLKPVEDRQAVLDAVGQAGGFAIMCHPNWEEHFNHCPQEKLASWTGYVGLEICNGVCVWAEGSGLALDRWDMLLSAGRVVWGYATDDTHKVHTEGNAWTVVQAVERSVEGVVDALVHGRCYASTGVTIETIEVKDDTVRVVAPRADRIDVLGDFQRLAAKHRGPEACFRFSEEDIYSYVRFECHGPEGAMAWTQPFFVEIG